MGAIIRKSAANGKQYQFICNSWETRNSWGHAVTLYDPNDRELNSVRVRYYNRTWECYQYQSAAQSCIYEVIQRAEARTVDAWKEANGRKRITKDERAAIVAASEYVQELRSVYNSL